MPQPENKETDLTNCNKEPINISGHIQSHGFLLVIDKKSLKIEQASENTSEYSGIPVQDLLGKEPGFLFPEENASFSSFVEEEGQSHRLLKLRERDFFCFAHISGQKIVLECEAFSPQAARETMEANSLLAKVQAQVNKLTTLEEIAGCLANALQAVLDYDRVLFFRFDPDWHAEVVAEKIKAGVHSYEGHHFPASDIPAPARELLLEKHIRHIPNVSAPAVAVVPYLNPSTNAPTDILQSEFRYPSLIHLEYLTNMGVGASLSFSVIVRGKLWGLISCTNKKPKYVSYWKRQLGDQLSKTFANILVSSQEKRDFEEFTHYKELEERLLDQIMSNDNNIPEGLLKKELNLLDMSRAGGVAIFLDKRIKRFGNCPEEKELQKLVDWLSSNNNGTVFFTRHLSARIKEVDNFRNKASGLLALEISRFNKEYILYFKPEIKEKRIWAGNPEKPVAGKDLRIHPRKSFEKWEEEIKGKSQPWTINEVEIARILLKDVVAVRLRNQARKLAELKEEYQVTAEGLEIKNKQLEDFARIITHNLRSPLANVQALHSIYEADPQAQEAAVFLDKIKGAVDNMLATIDDLNLVLRSRLGDQLQLEKVSIRKIIDKERQSLEAEIEGRQVAFIIDLHVPEININRIYFESILHNLLSNAVKYSAPERRPRIEVQSWLEGKEFYLAISDNGLGIDLEKYGGKIFGIYKTFHKHPNSRGVGLYLTKMQVEAMGGRIEVKSQPGKGTTFVICFKLPLSVKRP